MTSSYENEKLHSCVFYTIFFLTKEIKFARCLKITTIIPTVEHEHAKNEFFFWHISSVCASPRRWTVHYGNSGTVKLSHSTYLAGNATWARRKVVVTDRRPQIQRDTEVFDL